MDYKAIAEQLEKIADSDPAVISEWAAVIRTKYLKNAADAITALLARAEAAEERAEKAEMERDAAIKDLCIAEDCDTCKSTACVPRGGNGRCRFEWRGQKEE